MGGISVACKKHAERKVGKQRKRLDDEPRVLFPDMLAHEEQHEFAGRHADPLPGFGEEAFRIVGHQVGAVVHDLDLPLVAVFPDDIDHGRLRHPHEVGLLVEVDYGLQHQVHRRPGQHPLEVVAVLRMESRDQGYLLQPRHPQRRMAGGEGAVGMDYPEAYPGYPGQIGGVEFGDSRHIRMPAGHRDRKIVKDLVRQTAVVGPWHVGSDDADSPRLLLHPFGIVLHADRHPVHHRREAVAEQADISLFRRKHRFCRRR